MTIVTFNVIDGVLTMTCTDAAPPTTVQFTLADGTIVNRTTPDSTVGTEYTYTGAVSDVDGIFSVLIDSGLATETVGVIAIMSDGVSCLLHKTLKGELDSLLMQQLYAVEMYVFSDLAIEARNVYAIIKRKCVTCATGALYDLVNSSIFIVNSIKTVV